MSLVSLFLASAAVLAHGASELDVINVIPVANPNVRPVTGAPFDTNTCTYKDSRGYNYDLRAMKNFHG